MKKQAAWVWGAILLVALVIWWPFSWPNIPGLSFNFGGNGDDTEELMTDHKRQLDSLQAIIKLYQEDVSELNSEIESLNGRIGDLKYTIQRRENTIANLKKETNENINTVTKFTTTDIYKFLSDRYKSSDTTSISR